jgi:hypothetical protein
MIQSRLLTPLVICLAMMAPPSRAVAQHVAQQVQDDTQVIVQSELNKNVTDIWVRMSTQVDPGPRQLVEKGPYEIPAGGNQVDVPKDGQRYRWAQMTYRVAGGAVAQTAAYVVTRHPNATRGHYMNQIILVIRSENGSLSKATIDENRNPTGTGAEPGMSGHGKPDAGGHEPGDMAADRESLLRKNIAYLPEAELQNLREAFRRLQDSGAYDGQVYLHANYAEHYNSLIWPWHRAYLLYFEKKLQEAVPEADPPVTLPYWHYDDPGSGDTFRKLPEPFRPRLVNGRRNPFYYERFRGVNEGSSALSYASVRTDRIIRGFPDYFDFRPALESGPHANVHNWVGPTMSNLSVSPRDPIFWLHHANMDRVWERWSHVAGHQNPTDPRWKNQPLRGFQDQPRNKAGDFLSLGDLGYSYVEEVIDVRVAAAADKRRLASPNFSLKAASAHPADRIVVQFSGVVVPQENFTARVFLGLPGADESTPADDPHFVGEFTLLAMRGGGHRMETSVNLDATEVVRALLAKEKPSEWVLTLVPVRNEGATATADVFQFKRCRIITAE